MGCVMFSRVRMCVGGAVVASTLVSASVAGAVTATLSALDFGNRTQLAAARQAMDDYVSGKSFQDFRAETFEDLDAWKAPGDTGTANPASTNVGRFEGFGDAGTGASKIKGGTAAEVRADKSMAWGRYNTDLLPDDLIGGNWLDSNDMTGIRWTVEDVGSFDTLAFFLIDAEDVGGKFSVNVAGQTFSSLAGSSVRRDGNLMMVIIELSEAVTSLTVEMFHDRTNDGFGIDGAMIARASNLAPVPLPPAAGLLLAGFAVLAGVRRRNRARAA